MAVAIGLLELLYPDATQASAADVLLPHSSAEIPER